MICAGRPRGRPDARSFAAHDGTPPPADPMPPPSIPHRPAALPSRLALACRARCECRADARFAALGATTDFADHRCYIRIDTRRGLAAVARTAGCTSIDSRPTPTPGHRAARLSRCRLASGTWLRSSTTRPPRPSCSALAGPARATVWIVTFDSAVRASSPRRPAPAAGASRARARHRERAGDLIAPRARRGDSAGAACWW